MMIFVFGSNEAGFHGAGAAAYAVKTFNAKMGCGFGRQGMAFAIPTKKADIITSLEIERITEYVNNFIEYAKKHPELVFQVTQIGCGLAGFKPEQIAPLFAKAPSNCTFDKKWSKWLPNHVMWGTQ